MTRPPHEYLDDADLLRAAERILAAREVAYPRLVKAGQLAAEDAELPIRAMAAVVADLRRIVALEAGQPAAPRDTSATWSEKMRTIEAAERSLAAKHAAIEADMLKEIPADWADAWTAGRLFRGDLEDNLDPRRWPSVPAFLAAQMHHAEATGLRMRVRTIDDAHAAAEIRAARHQAEAKERAA